MIDVVLHASSSEAAQAIPMGVVAQALAERGLRVRTIVVIDGETGLTGTRYVGRNG